MSCFSSLEESSVNELKQSKGVTVIFKHSTRCSISSTALNRVNSYCAKTDKDIRSYLVNVIEERATSNAIANELLIQHQSPQLIILNNGEVVYHESHLGITERDLISQIEEL